MNQSAVFLEGEGDNYFLRNRAALEVRNVASEIEWLGQSLSPFKDKVNDILEIGCSNGAKLKQICGLLDAKGQGIDPSKQAVEREIAGFQGGEYNFTLARPHVCLLNPGCRSILSILDSVFICSTVRTYSPPWLKLTEF